MPDPSVRLYLITPPINDPDGFAPQLQAALQTPSLACVLLRLTASAGPALRRLVALVQAGGAAALVENDAALAIDLGADGVHVRGSGEARLQALRRLKPDRIVGVGGLDSRDDAMVAGEGEADYLMFGDKVPDQTIPAFEERFERVAWWAEIFQVPCVACVYAFEEIAPFAEQGAEFVAVGDLVWCDPRGIATAMAEAEARLREGEAMFLARQAERA